MLGKHDKKKLQNNKNNGLFALNAVGGACRKKPASDWKENRSIMARKTFNYVKIVPINIVFRS